jgi:small GTP-binding protein
VVQKLIDHLAAQGAHYDSAPEPTVSYPEASTALEAEAMQTIAQAASPAAIDLLAKQNTLWQDFNNVPAPQSDEAHRLLQRSRVLDRLVTPPTVVVVGPPNVGKSTLTNQLLGQSVSLVADLPGTTRDWVSGLAELNVQRPAADGPWTGKPSQSDQPIDYWPSDMRHSLAVRWLDTPGLHATHDAIEQHAIDLARQVLREADVLIAMRDPHTDWPGHDQTFREPDLFAINKCDDEAPPATSPGLGRTRENPLSLSAEQSKGLDALQHAVAQTLGLTDLHPEQRWAFSPTLRRWLKGQVSQLSDYLKPR